MNALEFPIVLTATVIPNGVVTASFDPETRLEEYRKALEFYLRHAPVVFLENSNYPLEKHDEFRETSRLRIRRFAASKNPERGKGYQEFEMLDAWLSSEVKPPTYWMKITGRYRILNIQTILNECRSDLSKKIIIDQTRRTELARTYSFFAASEFYKKHMRGLYQKCDDRTGDWIERVLFQKLREVAAKQVRLFKTQPRILATAGSCGAAFPTGKTQWWMKQILRNANRLIDERYLWYSK